MNIRLFECSADMRILAVVISNLLIVTVKGFSNENGVTKNQIHRLKQDLVVQKAMNAQLRAGLYHPRFNRGLNFIIRLKKDKFT